LNGFNYNKGQTASIWENQHYGLQHLSLMTFSMLINGTYEHRIRALNHCYLNGFNYNKSQTASIWEKSTLWTSAFKLNDVFNAHQW